MSRLPWFPLFPQDYDADTADLTLEEDGLYSRMLRKAWYTSPDGCSLPADVSELSRTLSLPQRTLNRLSTVIDRYWVVDGDRIVSTRLREEAEKSGNKSKSQSDRAKRGWSTRIHRAYSGQPSGNDPAVNGECPSDAIQIHRESESKDLPSSSAETGSGATAAATPEPDAPGSPPSGRLTADFAALESNGHGPDRTLAGAERNRIAEQLRVAARGGA